MEFRRVLSRSYDLHVLGMPPAFVLSQDQTLRLIAQHQQPSLAAQPPAPSSNKSKSVTFDWRNLPAQPGRSPHQATPSDAQSDAQIGRSEEHTSELQSLMRISYAVFCLKTK